MARTPVSLVAAAALFLLATPGPAGEHELQKVIKSGELKEKLEALKKLADGDDPAAEELLLLAIEDKDWEVAEKACEALARKAGEKSVRPLAELSFQGPIRRLRLAAAAALGARQPEAGAKLIQGAVIAKDDVTAACAAEALGEIHHPSGRDRLKAALVNKSAYVRREAAQALGALRDDQVVKDLEPVLKDPDIRARCGAVEGVARVGDPRSIPLLLTELQEPKLPDIVERRIGSAIRRILLPRRQTEEAEAAVRKVAAALSNEAGGVPAARFCRVLGSLARAAPPAPPSADGGDRVKTPSDGSSGGPAAAPPPDAPDAAKKPAEPSPVIPGAKLAEGEGPVCDPVPVAKTLIEAGLAHKEPPARRAAAWALGRVGGDAAIAALEIATISDTDPLTRFHALRAYRRWKTAKDDAAFQLFCKVLRYDKSPLVREEAAVALGVKGIEGSLETLSKATLDAAWEVAVASAVSLGKTRDPGAIAALTPLLASKDWKLRGAGAAGIGWSNKVESVPILIGLLADPEVTVSRTSWEFLKRVTDKDLPPKQKEWEAWWAEKGKGFEIFDREAAFRDAKKYGYAMNDKDVYENLDVLVLVSRGDKIENLLTTLEIKHRLTKAASVKRDGVQPFGVFVSNCTGEMQPDDHERVSWFVHAGGALFGSCWAVDKTVNPEFANTMCRWRGFPGEVLAQAQAEECPTETEYLNGVFPALVRPIYELWGAHLIEILDPERLEVLIESPETAAKFNGCGNLAAWFTAGHGVVMASSAHFDRQTMTKLQGAWGVQVKTETDRKAFAIDHFGYTFAKIRELDQKNIFQKQSEAEKEVSDLSAFRFLTNFVRRKRIIDL